MTERDTFAAAALTGLLSGKGLLYTADDRGTFCAAAWALADAMLAERGDKPSAPAAAAPTAGSVTLTDEERRELEAAASDYENGAAKIVYGSAAYRLRAATLRGLLARAAKEGR
jgi:hypothetical protein